MRKVAMPAMLRGRCSTDLQAVASELCDREEEQRGRQVVGCAIFETEQMCLLGRCRQEDVVDVKWSRWNGDVVQLQQFFAFGLEL